MSESSKGSGDSFSDQLRTHGRAFFTNWSEYDASLGRKIALTLKNRARSLYTLKGCCGNDGEPGC